MVINKTDMSIGCIPDAIEEAICFFLQIYPYQPVCSYEIILCDFFDGFIEVLNTQNPVNQFHSLLLFFCKDVGKLLPLLSPHEIRLRLLG